MAVVDWKKIVIYAFVLSFMSWGSFELFCQHTTNADCSDIAYIHEMFLKIGTFVCKTWQRSTTQQIVLTCVWRPKLIHI